MGRRRVECRLSGNGKLESVRGVEGKGQNIEPGPKSQELKARGEKLPKINSIPRPQKGEGKKRPEETEKKR